MSDWKPQLRQELGTSPLSPPRTVAASREQTTRRQPFEQVDRIEKRIGGHSFITTQINKRFSFAPSRSLLT